MTIHSRAVIAALFEMGGRDVALLRRSIHRDPGTDPAVFRLIEPLVPANATAAERAAVYLVAALRAQLPPQPPTGPVRSFGRAWGRHAAQRHRQYGPQAAFALTQRFDALLDADAEGLARHLIHCCAALRAVGIVVGWVRLLEDLCHWDDEDRPVQRRWARDYTRLTWYRRAGAGRAA